MGMNFPGFCPYWKMMLCTTCFTSGARSTTPATKSTATQCGARQCEARQRGARHRVRAGTYLPSIPKFPGLSRVFSLTPECYFINPEKSRNWLHSTFLYTHPDLLVTGERQTADMCSPEEDVPLAYAEQMWVYVAHAVSKYFLYLLNELWVGTALVNPYATRRIQFFQYRHFLAVENYSGRLVTVLVVWSPETTPNF